MRSMLRASAFAILILSAPGAALACADGPDFYGVRDVAADDVLNVRSGPSLDYSVIATLPPDATGLRNLDRVPVHLCSGNYDTLTDFEKNNLWTKIQWEGEGRYVVGWVKSRFLGESAE